MKIPIAVYRLQLNANLGCDFNQAENLLDYLKILGISDLYLSPIMRAQAGSCHGYDVVDNQRINPELGGEHGFLRLSNQIQSKKMGIVLDIVPNHMAATKENSFWMDVLEKGKKSSYAKYFDIDWSRSTSKKIFYRRFFDINELVCLRMEDPEVFQETHRLILKLIRDEKITGLRIDHVDGLIDPLNYFKNLTQAIRKPFYIIVEKILTNQERLSREWPIQGTTGYDFLNELNQLFIHPDGFLKLQNFYHAETKNSFSLCDRLYETGKEIIQTLFKKELKVLQDKLLTIFNLLNNNTASNSIEKALIEISACLRAYRTYINSSQPLSEADYFLINKALEKFFIKNNQKITSAFEILKKIFTLDFTKQESQRVIEESLKFLKRWQVFTGPVAAKSYEDTFCYRYNALLSINEVGGSPELYSSSGDIERFHQYNLYLKENFPFQFLTTSTHDTKRSEDIRARLNVLSELSAAWEIEFRKWHLLNQDKKILLQEKEVPSTDEEILIYQTLLGAWPLDKDETNKFQERLIAFIVKAVREAKINSSWSKPNHAYEEATLKFINAILKKFPENKFLMEFKSFQEKIAFYGMLNSLSQVVLKSTSVGIPDFYQGNELLRYDLVDPDNRREINFKKLISELNLLEEEESNHRDKLIKNLMTHWTNGHIKLYITYKLLQLRSRYPALFLEGNYIPLEITGERSLNLIAYLRTYKNQMLLTAVPRWYTQLAQDEHLPLKSTVWGNTQIILPENTSTKWKSVFTEKILDNSHLENLYAKYLLADFPVFSGLFRRL